MLALVMMLTGATVSGLIPVKKLIRRKIMFLKLKLRSKLLRFTIISQRHIIVRCSRRYASGYKDMFCAEAGRAVGRFIEDNRICIY